MDALWLPYMLGIARGCGCPSGRIGFPALAKTWSRSCAVEVSSVDTSSQQREVATQSRNYDTYHDNTTSLCQVYHVIRQPQPSVTSTRLVALAEHGEAAFGVRALGPGLKRGAATLCQTFGKASVWIATSVHGKGCVNKVPYMRNIAPSFVVTAPYDFYLRQLSEPKQGISNHYHFVVNEMPKVPEYTLNKNTVSR